MLRYGIVSMMLASLAACGGGEAASGVAIRVGGSAITQATVDHWISVIAGGRTPSTPTHRYEALRQGAAELLISVAWATGEAAERGLKISARQLQLRLRARERADFPGGNEELQVSQAASGETTADLVLEAKAAWAASALRELIVAETPAVTRSQIGAYYKSHRERFAVPERREIIQTNRKSAAAAIQAKHEMAADRRLLSEGQTEMFTVAPGMAADEGGAHADESAMATARVDTLVGPIKQRVDYFVFEVKRVYPAHEAQLAQVSAAIASQLTSERRAHALAAFESAWIGRWSAKTSCSAGYVVAACRQYRGPRNLRLGFALAASR